VCPVLCPLKTSQWNLLRALATAPDPRALEYCERGLWDRDAGVRGEAARGMATLAFSLDALGQSKVSRRLIKVFIATRDRDVAKSCFFGITSLPSLIAERVLLEADSEFDKNLAEPWKVDLWQRILVVVSRAVDHDQLERALPDLEGIHLARLWGADRRTLADIVQTDLHEFVTREEENLWNKLIDFGRGTIGNQKERVMRDFMESHWRGLRRGSVLKEIPAGSGRIDLLMYYEHNEIVFELKLVKYVRDYAGGLSQLHSYLTQKYCKYGALVLFAEDSKVYNDLAGVLGGNITRSETGGRTVFIALVRAFRLPTPSRLRTSTKAETSGV
jgi:hypothetical protein